MIYPTGMITVEELQSIKLPIVNFAEGYKVAEVDVFLGKCADTLRNGYGLSVEEVEHHSFTSTYMGGYAMGDVNLLLDRIAWTLKNRPSGRRAMPTAQPYARPMPNQYPASQQYPPASQFPAAMPPQNQPVQSQYPMPSQPYPATPQSSAPMPLQAQPAPQYSMPQYPVQQPTTLGGLLSKARKNAEKFAKDNDLEGKLETGKSKAKEALSKAKNEASRAAQNLGDSIEEARSAYEEKKRVQEQDSERHATHTPQVWNKPLYDDSPSQRTMPIPPEDMPRMTFPGDRKNAGSDTESNKQTEIAEKKADSITDTRIVPEKTEPESTKENVSSEPEPAAEIVSKERAEVQTEVRTEEPASTVTIPVTPNDADSEPTVAMTESAVSSTPHWPSDKKQAQSDGYSDHHEVETHTATASDGFAALLEDKRKRTILIGCVAAFVLLLIALFCMSLSSEDSKNDKPATTPSYSHTTDSDDSADNNKPSTPSFEKVNTNSLKNRSVKEVTSELDGKSLSYKFLVDGGDGSDQTATVKTAVQNGEEWTVTEANQSMTDGEVTLTVREKEPAQQQKPQQADSNGIITAANNPEFAALLGVKDPFDSSVAAFAEKYKGRTIEFDGNIAGNIPNDKHPRYLFDDTLVYAGDYSTESVNGPSFRFEGITWSDFHDGSVGIPAFVREGQNVHIKATVDKYNPDNGIFKLDLVEMTER